MLEHHTRRLRRAETQLHAKMTTLWDTRDPVHDCLHTAVLGPGEGIQTQTGPLPPTDPSQRLGSEEVGDDPWLSLGEQHPKTRALSDLCSTFQGRYGA